MRIMRRWMVRFTSLELQSTTDLLLMENGDTFSGEIT
jgi:hypothetical protein